MNTKEKIEVMQAFEDGKEIEIRKGSNDDFEPIYQDPNWNWESGEYRIKPKEISLEDRVKAEYADFDVVMLEWSADKKRLLFFEVEDMGTNILGKPHIYAQSIKGFNGYVYEFEKQGLDRDFEPIWPQNQVFAVQPIAVLFSKDKS